ncbi:MAG: S8 family serine peptidase [Candidatus Schekmanbacteria bacterium]|nr:S8 family serine peptidase [Candidatus Schekmanbacteria bacterium]
MRQWYAALSMVLWVLPPAAVRATGSVTAEADVLHEVAQIRAETGLSGSGVKVGIIGLGILTWGNAVASGDLPSDLQVLDTEGGSDETIAFAEIIHDLAPNAALLFSYARTVLDVPDAIDRIRAVTGAGEPLVILLLENVEADSIFEDWVSAQAAQEAAADGILVIVEAGDHGASHYRGAYVAGAGDLHDFGGGKTRATMELPVNCPLQVTLYWSEPAAQITSQYRLLAYNEEGTLVSVGAFHGAYAANGLALASYDYVRRPQFEIEKLSGQDRTIDVHAICADHDVKGPMLEEEQRVATGSVIGAAAAPGVLTVGALDSSAPVGRALYSPHYYSNHGPVEIFFPDTVFREKPDLMALDGQSTTQWHPANGTAVAAAVVTGMAALLAEHTGEVETVQLKVRLTDTARDLGEPGYDRSTGYGQVDLRAALDYVPVPAFGAAGLVLIGLIVGALAVGRCSQARANAIGGRV